MKSCLFRRVCMKLRSRVLLGLLLLSATACKSSSKATIEAEKREATPAGALGTAAPDPYATVRPPDGPFERRSPPEGPPFSADLRPSAQVPPDEFFEVYAKEFGLGPKDEVRLKRKARNTVPGTPDSLGYQRYHDGYAVEDGWYTLNVKNGLVIYVMGADALDLPDKPRFAIPELRAEEIAMAEAARQTGQDRAEMRIHETDLVWVSRGHNTGQRFPNRGLPHDLVYRCGVADAGGNVHKVDIDVKTGAVTSFTDGTPVGALGRPPY